VHKVGYANQTRCLGKVFAGLQEAGVLLVTSSRLAQHVAALEARGYEEPKNPREELPRQPLINR